MRTAQSAYTLPIAENAYRQAGLAAISIFAARETGAKHAIRIRTAAMSTVLTSLTVM